MGLRARLPLSRTAVNRLPSIGARFVRATIGNPAIVEA